jgi:GNAT superfamily N-acetyltransferase
MGENTVRVLLGHEARQALTFFSLYKEYSALMRSFHGDTFFLEQEKFSTLLRSRTEMLACALIDDVLVGTAQATLIQTPPLFQVVINNVVVSEQKRQSGVGRQLLSFLEDQTKAQWGKVQPLRLYLTNAPSKRNGEFYRKLDFTPRIEEALTVVWEKII